MAVHELSECDHEQGAGEVRPGGWVAGWNAEEDRGREERAEKKWSRGWVDGKRGNWDVLCESCEPWVCLRWEW